MNKLYLTIGLIGSGKSTWAKKMASTHDKIMVVNRDSIREMITGGTYKYNVDVEPLIKEAAVFLTKQFLKAGFDVILDETNLEKKGRQELIYQLPFDIEIIYVHFTERKNNVNNRMTNPRGHARETWERVYNEMLTKFEPPEPSEGYDTIVEIKI